MNGSYNVAEKVLDYWFTIEFLAQDKFPVQGLDSKKAIKEAKDGKSKRKTLSHFLLFDNNTVDIVYETIISEVEKCGMKYWSNLTFYLGKVKREACIQSIAKAINYKGDWPEKNTDDIAWVSFQLADDGRYIEQTLSLSTIIWALNQISKSNISSAISIDKYKEDVEMLEKAFFKAENFFIQENENANAIGEASLFSVDKVPTVDLKKMSVAIAELYLRNHVNDVEGEVPYEMVYGVSFDMFRDEATKNKAEDDNYLGLSHDFFSDDIKLLIDMIHSGSLDSQGMDCSLLEYITESYLKTYRKGRHIDLIHPTKQKEFEEQVLDIVDIRNAPLGKWPSRYSPAFMQQMAINLQIDRRRKETEFNGTIFSVNGPPGTGKTTLLKEIIVHNVVERAKLLAAYDNPDDAFVKHRFLNGDKEGNAYSKYIRCWYSLANDDINKYSMLVTSCNNTAAENISKELPRGKDILEGLQTDSNDTDEYKMALTEVASLFDVKISGIDELTKDGEIFRDIYFTKHSRALLDDDSAWGLIAVALGKKNNISSFYNNVLAPIIFSDFYWHKNNAFNRLERYLDARDKFFQQLKRVELIERQLGELCELAKLCCKANRNHEKVCKSNNDSIEKIKSEIQVLETEVRRYQETYNQLQVNMKDKEEQQSCSNKRFEIATHNYNEKIAEIGEYKKEIFEASRSTGFFTKIFNSKKYKIAIQIIDNLEEKCRVANLELDVLGDVRKRVKGILDDANSSLDDANRVFQQVGSRISACKQHLEELHNKIEYLECEIRKAKEEYSSKRAAFNKLASELQNKGTLEAPNVIDERYIAELISEDDVKSTKAQIFNPWTSKQYDFERIKLFSYAIRLNKEFVLSTNRCRDNFKILAQYWGFLQGDDKEHIRFSRQDKEAFVASLYQTLFLLTPVISSTFASVGRLFRDVKKKEFIGVLIVDEAGQAQPQMAVGALLRSRKAMIVGDPKQVEPVVTDDLDLLKKLFNDEIIKPYSSDKTVSVQGFADAINPIGTYLANPGQDEDTWVGCPLIVHRRCISPMYDISNAISYNGIMKQQTRNPKEELEKDFIYNRSCWVNINGKEESRRRHFVPEQGKQVCKMLEVAFGNAKAPNLYIISPFTTVVTGIRAAIKEYFKENANISEGLYEWCEKNIGTVHKFQGKEANEVIFILGCDTSKDAEGAIRWVNTNIVNVAATRAKYRLYIIGDYEAWKKSECISKAKEIIDARS